jgi:hypothetical protein
MQISRVMGPMMLALPLMALAGDSLDVKLGLWEISYSTDIQGSLIPPSVLEKMPPAQRAKMQAEMQKRAATQPKNHVHKSCVTAEDIKKGAFRASDDKENPQCKTTVTAQSQTLQEATVACTGEESRTSHMRVEMQGRDHVEGRVENVVEGGGKVMVRFSGRWVSESCAGSDDR